MESEALRRRLNTIASHFAHCDDSRSATNVLPLNCSSSLNSVIQRCDNRMYFARQASATQSCFMRQASSEQTFQSIPKCYGTTLDKWCNATEEPLFSRPARLAPTFSNTAATKTLGQDCRSLTSDLPKFARPDTSNKDGARQFCSEEKIYSSEPNGTKWSPRMDVAESGRTYVMTVEIPGVSITDIRVEVDDQKLIVSGQRSTQCYKVTGLSNDSISAYHKKEIVRGPYQVVWPLPTNVNKDSIYAEFLDGFLKIIVPKF
ncbi:uncharacterized protein LOC110815119 [Carica papaya]|uniref:uncharacterized protein LOC110815119 n=1 Tax=Carica papaya TaxID=3649 RepID=UPI000B8C7B20|nr:uncharacterized protein LOC110815119 [Carica papaya]